MYREIIDKYTIKNANLREGKSLTSKIITVIPAMSKLELVDAEEDWLKVKYKNYEGYVYNENISKSLYPWQDVDLMERPSTTSSIIEKVPRKARVEKIGEEGSWSKVIYNDEEGYIYSYYLTDDGNKITDINYDDFYSNMTDFVNANRFESSTGYLLVTNLRTKETYVFEKEGDLWKQIHEYRSTVGKPSTPTIKGTFYIDGRKPFFGTDRYRVKYATRIRGPYYYHSTLFTPDGEDVLDDTLGEALSHGCIRLAVQNAKWIYDNIPDGTTVFIH